MLYILYRVTNTVNGKIYVGVHKTDNLDDGYMGSGKVIVSAIKKYGRDNFTRVILEQFDDSVTMYAREKEVVNEEFILREDTYNLRRGGFGGFDYILASGQHRSIHYKGIPLSAEHIAKIVATRARKFASGELDFAREKWSRNATVNNPMKTEIARQKVSEALTGRAKSVGHKLNISKSLMGRPSVNKGKKFPNRKKRVESKPRIVECPHCKKSGGVHGMTRWHFANCKNKGELV